MKKLQRTTI